MQGKIIGKLTPVETSLFLLSDSDQNSKKIIWKGIISRLGLNPFGTYFISRQTGEILV